MDEHRSTLVGARRQWATFGTLTMGGFGVVLATIAAAHLLRFSIPFAAWALAALGIGSAVYIAGVVVLMVRDGREGLLRKSRIYRRILKSWANVSVAVITMTLLVAILGVIFGEIIGPAALIDAGLISLAVAVAGFYFSELVVNQISEAEPADPEKHRVFLDVVGEIRRDHEWLLPPWVLSPCLKVGTLGGVPNACAYGWAFFRGSILVTPELYEEYTSKDYYEGADDGTLRALYAEWCLGSPDEALQLDRESLIESLNRAQLKAIIAHEFGHLRSRDVALMTALSVAQQMIGRWSSAIKAARGNPLVGLFANLVLPVVRFLVRVATAAVSQEREFAADAFATLVMGHPGPLCEALRRLSGAGEKYMKASKRSGKTRTHSPFEELTISHPYPLNRILALRSYARTAPCKGQDAAAQARQFLEGDRTVLSPVPFEAFA